MRIMVTGSRDWTDRKTIADAFMEVWPGSTLIHGGCRGADTLAEEYFSAKRCPIDVYPAEWERDGFAAGPIRNQRMLEKGKPDVVYAFWNGQSKGTLDAIRRAVNMGIKVEIYPPGWRRDG